MPRIFVAFVTGHLFVVLAVAALGLVDRAAGSTRHVALALFALLLSGLLQTVVFIYLAVTGKIIVQAVHLARFDLTPIYEAKRIKARFMGIMAVVIAVILIITATGAYQWREGVSSYYHLPAASLFLVVHLASAYLEFGVIRKNEALLARVLDEYGHRASPTSAPTA